MNLAMRSITCSKPSHAALTVFAACRELSFSMWLERERIFAVAVSNDLCRRAPFDFVEVPSHVLERFVSDTRFLR